MRDNRTRAIAECQMKVQKKFEEAYNIKSASRRCSKRLSYKEETVSRYKKNMVAMRETWTRRTNEGGDGDPANKVKISKDQRE